MSTCLCETNRSEWWKAWVSFYGGSSTFINVFDSRFSYLIPSTFPFPRRSTVVSLESKLPRRGIRMIYVVCFSFVWFASVPVESCHKHEVRSSQQLEWRWERCLYSKVWPPMLIMFSPCAAPCVAIIFIELKSTALAVKILFCAR